MNIFRFRVAKGSLSTQPQQLSFETAFPVCRAARNLLEPDQYYIFQHVDYIISC